MKWGVQFKIPLLRSFWFNMIYLTKLKYPLLGQPNDIVYDFQHPPPPSFPVIAFHVS